MRPVGYAGLCAWALGALVAGGREAEGADAVRPIEGATNASIHVLYDTTRALPVAGTFGWGISMLRVDSAHKVLLSEVEERMHRSLLEALPAEGFTYTNQAPDYLVGFAFLSGASLSEAELNASYGNLLAFPTRPKTEPSVNYDAGVLIVDVVECARGRLLWRGAVKSDIDLNLPDDRKQARCDGAIRELLRHYPSPANPR